MMHIWQESGVFNYTLIVTRNVQCGYLYQVSITKVLRMCRFMSLLSASYILGASMCLCIALCPYVSMGIDARWVIYQQVNNV